MSCRRNGLRKQGTETKEGPLKLRRKREGRRTCGVGEGEQGRDVGRLSRVHGECFEGLVVNSGQMNSVATPCVSPHALKRCCGQFRAVLQYGQSAPSQEYTCN